MSNINDKFGDNFFGGRMRIQTEVVNGVISYIPMGDPNTKIVLEQNHEQEKT